jgi:hypothetical protein
MVIPQRLPAFANTLLYAALLSFGLGGALFVSSG